VTSFIHRDGTETVNDLSLSASVTVLVTGDVRQHHNEHLQYRQSDTETHTWHTGRQTVRETNAALDR